MARILANENAETLISEKVSEEFVFEVVMMFSEAIEVVSSMAVLGSGFSIVSGISFLLITLFTFSATIDLSVIE